MDLLFSVGGRIGSGLDFNILSVEHEGVRRLDDLQLHVDSAGKDEVVEIWLQRHVIVDWADVLWQSFAGRIRVAEFCWHVYCERTVRELLCDKTIGVMLPLHGCVKRLVGVGKNAERWNKQGFDEASERVDPHLSNFFLMRRLPHSLSRQTDGQSAACR